MIDELCDFLVQYNSAVIKGKISARISFGFLFASSAWIVYGAFIPLSAEVYLYPALCLLGVSVFFGFITMGVRWFMDGG